MEDRPTYGAWSPPPTEPPAPPPTPPGPPLIAWEDPTRPWFAALVETVQGFFTAPRRTFERVPVRGDVLRPLLFAILVGWIGQFFFSVWEMTLVDPLRGMMPGNQFGDDEVPRGYWVAVMALAPLITAIGLMFSSAWSHVFLMLFGGARNGFAATFRALCYVQVAALLLALPFCGGIFAAAFALGLQIIGLSTLHRISLGRAAAAVLIPTFLCCACIFALALMFSAALLSMLGGLAR